ncbi:heterogeneous nuclear ribonucleoprotein Q-like [Pyrus communis]|uniref:heterogeneous nuclear ribonucleoprotein Q-like n=1 Tax=Pyrus communis TaxID=23211 RepID=UPI0035C06667
MPKTRTNLSGDASERLVESDERVDLEGDNDPEETIEEEVEYEEVEEEEEVEVEEEEEEEEEDPEEEVEEEDDNKRPAAKSNGQKSSDGDEEMIVADAEDEEEKKKHAELLARPPHGSEVYLGGIPHDASEVDLRGFCESIGEVIEVRVMKGKDSGEAKGYAFVTFRNKELASKAIEELNNSELKGKRIKCSTSQAKHRLFIGNVPRSWGEEDMKKAVTDIGPGVISVELLKNTEKYEIDGQVLECSLAKPQSDQKSSGSSTQQRSALLPTYPPRLGYGMVGGSPYGGGLGAGYGGPGIAQPLIYGRGPTPAGMAMMPMLLPDGRIRYVLQQPGVQPQMPPPQSRGGRSGGGGSSSGGRQSGESSRGRSRYNPY